MRPARSLVHLAMGLSTLGSVASASQWPRWLPDIDSLVVRAESTDTNTDPPPQTNAGSSQSTNSDPAPTGSQQSNSNTKSSSTKGGTKTNSGGPTHSSFNPVLPPAGISMMTPAPITQATGLYRIGDYVTLGWNYTGLLATPSAVDVLISCSANAGTWTLTSNMTFATSVNFVWDSQSQATDVSNPLLQQVYTLCVKDSGASLTQAPEAGYLGSGSGTGYGFQFGMYSPQPYTPYNEWTCPGSCSFGVSSFDGQAAKLAVMMSIVTVLSFTWFVSGLGLQ